MTCLIFARSNNDEKLGIRADFELRKFYLRTSLFLIVLVGAIVFLYAVDTIIVEDIIQAIYGNKGN